MNDNRNQMRDGLVFALLVLIGVAGRWAQPEWCFTPTAAAAIFAGCYFARLGIAALVPIAILGISDFALESHDNLRGDDRDVRGDDGAGAVRALVAGERGARQYGTAAGDLRPGAGDALLVGFEFRRVGVSERL